METKKCISLFTALALLIWLGGFHFNAIILIVSFVYFPNTWSLALFIVWLSLAFLPVNEKSAFGTSIAKFICKHVPDYFPIKVKIEDIESIDPNRSYVLAMEPHSVFPIGLLGITEHSNSLPLTKLKALASSAVFYTPIIRHLWSWLGLVPASKHVFKKLLNEGFSVGLVPGGVQECLYMKQGEEVLFLKKRVGFVKIAMETGSPLIPCFCFGQTPTYNWWKPSGVWYERFARRIGFAPLLFWGSFGTPVPFRSSMHFVIGKPIHFPKIENPTKEQVSEVHSQYLLALGQLFENHKVSAGFENLKLKIL